MFNKQLRLSDLMYLQQFFLLMFTSRRLLSFRNSVWQRLRLSMITVYVVFNRIILINSLVVISQNRFSYLFYRSAISWSLLYFKPTFQSSFVLKDNKLHIFQLLKLMKSVTICYSVGLIKCPQLGLYFKFSCDCVSI
jgi:hypothetical protein